MVEVEAMRRERRPERSDIVHFERRHCCEIDLCTVIESNSEDQSASVRQTSNVDRFRPSMITYYKT
jgi:hypothetical protein